jgi:hypothetical protein
VREALPTEPPRQPSRRSDSHPSGTKAAQTKTDSNTRFLTSQANPFIREKLDAKELKLHLWIVNDETARIMAFDPVLGALVPIEQKR